MPKNTIDFEAIEAKVKETENLNPEEVKQINALASKVGDHDKRLGEYEKELGRISTLIWLGFIVLVITVCGLVIAVFQGYTNNYTVYTERLNLLDKDQYEFINKRLNNLESKPTESEMPLIKPTREGN